MNKTDYLKQEEMKKLLEPYHAGIAGGSNYYDNVPISVIEKLYDMNALDVNDEGGWSLTEEGQFMLYFRDMKENHSEVQVWAHGYVGPSSRVAHCMDNTLFTIEGVCIEAPPGADLTATVLVKFVDYFRYADEFELTTKRGWCWYD